MKCSSVFLTLSILLVLSISTCSASEDTPTSLMTVSGNSSLISLGDNGDYQFLINGVNPNATILHANQTISGPLKKVLTSDPCAAAIVFSGTNGNETVFQVQVSNPVYSSDKQTLLWNVTPLKYYDGTILTEYSKEANEFESGSYSMTHVYLECPVIKIPNSWVIQ